MERQHKPKHGLPQLSAQDAELVDAMLDWLSGPGQDQAAEAWPGGQESPRAGRVAEWMSLIGSCPVEKPGRDLLAGTLAKVKDAEQTERFRRQIEYLTTPSRRWNWSDMGAVAAILLVGVSLLWPSLGYTRSEARRIACANNLGAAGAAMNSYASDHQGQMPRSGNFAGVPWYRVGQNSQTGQTAQGQVQSNSAHLYLIIRQGYINPAALACPENEQAAMSLPQGQFDWPNPDAVSYSYQNQFTARPIVLEGVPHLAILADKNPLFLIRIKPGQQGAELTFRKDLPATTASRFHRGGQNILRGDGTVLWSSQPWLPGSERDNIWLLHGLDHYQGTESPTRSDDAHLIP
ncbi:MAG: hypothetical protein IT443_12195 [Phycisphaeraceae bacterium]|nr:hypothetical protein [Phycisphaeraceae bacterium]